MIAADACLDNCRNAACGDGVIFLGVEDCDDGNRNDSDSCTNNCFYGDGPCELKYTGNGEVAHTAFTFHNNCDVVEQVGRRLGGGA